MTKDPRVYLAHILERATRIEEYLIHGYEGVDLGRVWSTASRDLPAVRSAIAALLPPLEQLERELAGEAEPEPGKV